MPASSAFLLNEHSLVKLRLYSCGVDYKNCLVTGAGGFIGSHLVEKLLSLDKNVRALVHYRGDGSAGWLGRVGVQDSRLQVVSGDVRDPHQVAEVLDDVDVVFHLAALIGIPYSFAAPNSYVETNVIGTQNLLEGSRKRGIKAFVQTSTSEVYGTAQRVPMPESHPLNPQSPYAASKVAADALANSYFHSFALPVTVLRPFNTFGPRQSARAVIPTIITQLLDPNVDALELGNLETRRDFTFVADTVNGFLLAAKQIDVSAGKTINLGAGWDIGIGELAELCMKLTGRTIPVIRSPERHRPNTSEVEVLCSDNSLAKSLLDWSPGHSTPDRFESALSETSSWLEKQLIDGEYIHNGYQK